MSCPRVAVDNVFSLVSGTALSERVLVPGEAVGPCGGLDGVADVRRHGQAVPAPLSRPFRAPVGAHEEPDPAAPQAFGDVVEDQVLPGIARVGYPRVASLGAFAAGSGR